MPALSPLREGRQVALAESTRRTSRRAWGRDALRRRMLAGADCISVLALAVALALVTGSAKAGAVTLAVLPLSILIAKVVGLYDADHRVLRHLTVDEFPRIFRWTALTVAASVLIVDAFDLLDTRVGWVLLAWLAYLAAATIMRALARALWRSITPRERAVIIGDGPLVETTRRKI